MAIYPSIEPAQSPGDYAQARVLIEEYAVALAVDLEFQGITAELADLEKAYGPPRGCLLLLRDEAGLAGCVAIRGVDEPVCEMKRLYLRAPYRGRALGKRLVESAIDHARRLGYRRIVLDTLPGMTEAQALYTSLGFVEIQSYYPSPLAGTRYFALAVAER